MTGVLCLYYLTPLGRSRGLLEPAVAAANATAAGAKLDLAKKVYCRYIVKNRKTYLR